MQKEFHLHNLSELTIKKNKYNLDNSLNKILISI